MAGAINFFNDPDIAAEGAGEYNLTRSAKLYAVTEYTIAYLLQ